MDTLLAITANTPSAVGGAMVFIWFQSEVRFVYIIPQTR